MKNQNQNPNLAITLEYKLNKSETVTTMETVCFTDISEKGIKSVSALKYCQLLGLIAVQNNLNCDFTPIGLIGTSEAIIKAEDILINSIKYN